MKNDNVSNYIIFRLINLIFVLGIFSFQPLIAIKLLPSLSP